LIPDIQKEDVQDSYPAEIELFHSVFVNVGNSLLLAQYFIEPREENNASHQGVLAAFMNGSQRCVNVLETSRT
jgi:hypothetical protein